MKRLYHLIIHWPKIVLLLILAFTGFLGTYAVHLRIDSSVEHLLATNDPNKKYYEEIRALFGSDDMGVIGIVAENVYTPGTLEKIKLFFEWVGNIRELESFPTRR